jgi:CRP-like cAMP-binding protein
MRTRISKQELELLGRVPLFSGCSQAELRDICRLGSELEVEEGRVLTEEGAPGREFFLVIEGKADCTIGYKPVCAFGPGDYFGELALLDGGPRTATVTAGTPMRVVVLSVREFSGLLRSSKSIAIKMLANVAGRLRSAERAVNH